MPTISVVIPTFNCAGFLGEAVDSALNQTYQDIEIIVVDDGSQDGTEKVVQRYGNALSYVKQPNSGPAAARNRGIKMSSGKYVAFLDADDLWVPRKLEEQVRHLEQDPEVGLVCSDFAVVSAKGTAEGCFLKKCRHARSGYVFDEIIQECFILTSTVVVRRLCLDEVGGFDESLVGPEDRDLWIRICHRWKIKVLPTPLVTKRNRPNNITSNSMAATPYRIMLFQKALSNFHDLSARSRHLIHKELSANYFDLGYHDFDLGRKKEARSNLAASLRYCRRNLKPFIYLTATYLPDFLIQNVRRMKRGMSRLLRGARFGKQVQGQA